MIDRSLAGVGQSHPVVGSFGNRLADVTLIAVVDHVGRQVDPESLGVDPKSLGVDPESLGEGRTVGRVKGGK